MLFSLMFATWIVISNSSSLMLLPCVGLFLRSAYKKRSISLFKKEAIIFAIILLIINMIVAEKNFDENLSLSLRILLFSALFIHIIDGIEDISFKKIPQLEFSIYYGIRLLSLIMPRQRDMWYVLKARYKTEKNEEKLKMLYMTFVNFFIEIILLNKQLNMLMFERGGMPETNEWRIRKRSKNIMGLIPMSFLGDLLLLFIIFIPLFFSIEFLYPAFISSLLSF